MYPLEPQASPFSDVGVNVRVLWPGDPNALYHRHVIIGAGDRPCAILMIGARPDEPIRFPVSELAARHGASVAEPTDRPDKAYADWPGEYQPVRLSWLDVCAGSP